MNYSNLEADAGDEFAILDLESEADTRGMFITHPFTRSRDANVVGQFGVERRHVQQKFGGPLYESDSEDKVLVVTLGATADYRDTILAGGVSTVGLAIQTRVDRLGSLEPSRLGAKGSFVKLGMSYSRLQYLTPSTSAVVRLSGQFSEDALISSEQLSLGGPAGVRSFVSGEGLADTGFVATAEVRHRLGLQDGVGPNSRIIGGFNLFESLGAVGSDLRLIETRGFYTTAFQFENIAAGFYGTDNVLNEISYGETETDILTVEDILTSPLSSTSFDGWIDNRVRGELSKLKLGGR